MNSKSGSKTAKSREKKTLTAIGKSNLEGGVNANKTKETLTAIERSSLEGGMSAKKIIHKLKITKRTNLEEIFAKYENVFRKEIGRVSH